MIWNFSKTAQQFPVPVPQAIEFQIIENIRHKNQLLHPNPLQKFAQFLCLTHRTTRWLSLMMIVS
jgi:hypothetical protein